MANMMVELDRVVKRDVGPPRRLVYVVGLFLLAHLVLAIESFPALWGMDMLAYAPFWVNFVFVVGSGVLLVPWARRFALVFCRRLLHWSRPWESWRARLVFACGALLVFVLLRSEVHLLGDGYLMLRELAMLATRSGNEPLALWFLEQLYRMGLVLGLGAEDIFRGTSYAAGGLYVLLVFPASARLARVPSLRPLVCISLLTMGYVQIFCGYVETYALLFPGLLFYLYLGAGVVRKGQSPAWAALFLALLSSYHFIAFMLAPSLLVLLWSARRRGVGALCVQLLPSLLLGLAVLYLLGVDIFSYTGGLRSSHLLPLAGSLDYAQAYVLFSPLHILDQINEYLLVVPMAIMLLTGLGITGRRSGDQLSLFFLFATFATALFTFVANPEIGSFRDWDILAVPALPFVLWALSMVRAESLGGEGTLLLGGAAALHLLAWVGLNADADAALVRYETLMQRAPLSAHARSYGWETLGFYYRETGERERARAAFEQATEANPANVRHWQALAGEYTALKQRGAVAALVEATRRDSLHADLWDMLGSAYAEEGDAPASAAAHRRALALDAGNVSFWFNLGNAHMRGSEPVRAVEAFTRALSLDARSGKIHFNQGIALGQLGDWPNAERAYLAALERGYTAARFNLALVYVQLDETEKAVQMTRAFLREEEVGERAELMRLLLQERD